MNLLYGGQTTEPVGAEDLPSLFFFLLFFIFILDNSHSHGKVHTRSLVRTLIGKALAYGTLGDYTQQHRTSFGRISSLFFFLDENLSVRRDDTPYRAPTASKTKKRTIPDQTLLAVPETARRHHVHLKTPRGKKEWAVHPLVGYGVFRTSIHHSHPTPLDTSSSRQVKDMRSFFFLSREGGGIKNHGALTYRPHR